MMELYEYVGPPADEEAHGRAAFGLFEPVNVTLGGFDHDEVVFLLELVDEYRGNRLLEGKPRDVGAEETSAKLSRFLYDNEGSN